MRWRLYFLLSILFLLLAGCGSVASTATTPELTSLHVERYTDTPNHFPPLARTITREDAVQKLYKAALALPKSTDTRARSCPADFGLVYHLRFLHANTLIQQMDLNPGGCSWIVLSKDDSRPTTLAFLELFAQTVGIPNSQVNAQPLPLTTKPVP